MPKRKPDNQSKRPIESYDHRDKDRLNNPAVGLVTPETDRDAGTEDLLLRPPSGPAAPVGGQGGAHLLRGAHGVSACA